MQDLGSQEPGTEILWSKTKKSRLFLFARSQPKAVGMKPILKAQ